MSFHGRVSGTRIKRALGVQAALEWAFRIEQAQLELPLPPDVTEEGFGFGLEYVLLQRAVLGCKIDGGQHKIGGYTHEDAEVIAATVAGIPDSLGGKRMAIHAGARKVDANPYQPLPEAVRARIAGELEDLRQLFAETVAEGRGRRLDTLQALGTEAAVFRGEAAVFAGLADEVADPVTAFRAFAAAPRGTTNPRGKGPMMTTAPEDHAQPATAPAASTPPEPTPPTAVAPPQTAAAAMSPEAIRAEAAEVAQVCAQAARLGIQIDAADAVAKGVKPEALRSKVLADLAARSDAAGIIASAPAAGAKESPIVAAAKKSAAASR